MAKENLRLYKGKDGHSYQTPEQLSRADTEYDRTHNPPIRYKLHGEKIPNKLIDNTKKLKKE
jgi:hypothetical protein